MVEVKEDYALGNYVYDFQVILANEEKTVVPYQLSFAKDYYVDRTSVLLLNYFFEDDNNLYCSDIRTTVCDCFNKFFAKNPDEKVYFEMELGHKRNLSKFLKFWRWAKLHQENYKFKAEIVDKDDVLYGSVTITKK